MADEFIQDAHEGGADPLEDALETGESGESGEILGGAEGTGDGNGQPDEGNDPIQGALAGTPFKDVAGLSKSYKEIQRLVSSKDREIAELNRKLEMTASAIQQLYQKREDPQAAKGGLPEGDAFWKALADNPADLIRQIARMEHEALYKERIDPRLGKVEGSLGSYEKSNLVQSFLQKHPEFTVEDEALMVDILDANPQLKDMQNGLDIAYNQVLADRYRSSQQRNAAGAAVAGAKGIAGLGGKKTSLPAQAQRKDPFDDVLALDRDERETFKLGRA